jgi:hypothetical protein
MELEPKKMDFTYISEPMQNQAEEICHARTKKFLASHANMALTVMSICKEAAAFLCDSIIGADEKVSYSYPRTIYRCPFELGLNDFDERSMAPMFPSPDFREYHEQLMAHRNAEKFERFMALKTLSTEDCYWLGFREFQASLVKCDLDEANKRIVIPSPMKPGTELNYDFLDEFAIPLIFELYFDSKYIPVGGLFFRVFPSVHDNETNSDYFPIVVGIAYFDPKLKRELYWWDRLARHSQLAWSKLLLSIDRHIKKLSVPASTSGKTLAKKTKTSITRIDSQLQELRQEFKKLHVLGKQTMSVPGILQTNEKCRQDIIGNCEIEGLPHKQPGPSETSSLKTIKLKVRAATINCAKKIRKRALNADVNKRRHLVQSTAESNPQLLGKSLDKQTAEDLDFAKVSLYEPWVRDFGVKTWVMALASRKIQARVRKMFSVDRNSSN